MNSIFNSDKVNAYNNQDKPMKSIGSTASPPYRSATIAVDHTTLGNRVSNMSIRKALILFAFNYIHSTNFNRYLV